VRNPSENPLISLGYEGRDAADLIEQLRASGVNALVDVRLTPLSRKPGRTVEEAAGCRPRRSGHPYVRLPQLGNPKENRAPFRAGAAESHEEYRRILQTSNGRSALAHVVELLEPSAPSTSTSPATSSMPGYELEKLGSTVNPLATEGR
jgi:uncharacterized protein (DUF488 family)